MAQISITPLALFASSIAMQCLLIGCILPLLVDGNRRANAFLTVFFLLLACRVASYFLYFSDLSVPSIYLFMPVLYSLAGPCFYFYVRTLSNRTASLNWRDMVHIWPLVIVTGVALFIWGGKQGTLGPYPVDRDALKLARVNLVFDLVFLVYLGAAWKSVREYQNELRQILSRIDAMISLSWLKSLIYLLLVAWVCLLIIDVLRSIGIIEMSVRAWFEQFVAQALVLLVAIGSIRQRMIRLEPLDAAKDGDDRAYARSEPNAEALNSSAQPDDTRTQRLWSKIERHMNEEKFFLDNDLSLHQLSAALSSRPQLVSQAINQYAKMSFYDYVNGLRITEAQRLLGSPEDQRMSMLAVSEASGFNSQSTFYNHFKKRTGMTPKQFRTKATA